MQQRFEMFTFAFSRAVSLFSVAYVCVRDLFCHHFCCLLWYLILFLFLNSIKCRDRKVVRAIRLKRFRHINCVYGQCWLFHVDTPLYSNVNKCKYSHGGTNFLYSAISTANLFFQWHSPAYERWNHIHFQF